MSVLFPYKALLETGTETSLGEISETYGRDELDLNQQTSNNEVDEARYEEKKSEIIYCLSSIVDDAIDQIHILSGGKKYENSIDEFSKSLEERAKISFIDDPIFDIITGDPYEVAFRKRKLKKVLEDSAKIKEFLMLIRNELRESHSYKSVQLIMEDIQRRRNEEKNLLQEEQDNFKKMKNLKHLLITQSRDCQRELQKINESYAISRDQTQDLLFENLIRVRYIKEWENARNEQNDLLCEKGEGELEEIISKCKSEIEKEIRINSEIETYLLENLKDMEKQIDVWMIRFENEIESRNVQIQLLKEKREELMIQYEDLKVLYALHTKEIESFLEFKETKRTADQALERQVVAVIKLQAWWRGNMVRHKLGRFNPNPKRKGKGKGKGKKGKGKKK